MMSKIAFHSAKVDCEWIESGSFLTESGGSIDLQKVLGPIFAVGDTFFPKAVYVREEMCQVFAELIKSDRKRKQILIGSPGVGKSVLLFLVAMYRTLKGNNKPGCFIRKTRDTEELTSVFFFKRIDARSNIMEIHYNREIHPDTKVTTVLELTLQEHQLIQPDRALPAVLADNVILYIDGLHQGDPDLNIPHHYLCTCGGYDTPVGESARHATLVVMSGWQRDDLGKALQSTSDILHNMQGTTQDEALEDIFYHAGGRIRDALDYTKNPKLWKSGKTAMISRIPKEEVKLSIVDTKGSGDPSSPDRVRTMFRNDDSGFFGSALQIVDSQFYARQLQDRVGLEEYYNAYMHAKNTGLSSPAGCHFEELLHRLFHRRPSPIKSVLQSHGTGAEGVGELRTYGCYWIPSIPNFANIDAALVLENPDNSVTVWCLQYTVSKEHKFNSTTFRSRFLRPLANNFGRNDISVKVVFVVPQDVFLSFQRPEDVELDDDFEGFTEFVDCSTVDAVESVFGRLDFIEKPVKLKDSEPVAQRPRNV